MSTKTFRIAPDLDLPHEAVTQTFAILARKGAGKSCTGKVLAEEMLQANFPIVAIDPTGAWWGLRSHYKIAILGGEHADAALDPTSGKTIASFVIRERMPVVLDLSLMGEAEMQRFVGDFGTEFYLHNREAIHLFVDEADEFAPQQSAGGPLAKCLGAMQRIVRRGRIRGIGTTLITQRSAVISKSVLTQTECLVAMQITGPHDLRAIDDWLKYHGTPAKRDEIMHDLPTLAQREAWVYSPGWLKILKRVKIRELKSYDSSATPRPGETARPPKKLAEIDLGALTKQLAATIERAKADDPTLLKKRIAELERQLNGKATAGNAVAVVDQASIDRAVVRATAERDRHWTDTLNKFERVRKSLVGKLDKIRELSLVNGEATPHVAIPPQPRPTPAVVERRVTRHAAEHTTAAVGDTKLGKCERAVLRAAYWLRDEVTTRSKLSFFSGYSVKSSSFDKALSNLRTAGMLKGIEITDAGARLVGGDVPPKPTGAELRAWLRSKLGKADNAILDAVMTAAGERMEFEAIARLSGYSETSSSFDKSLSTLRTIEAIDGNRASGVKAAEVFFA